MSWFRPSGQEEVQEVTWDPVTLTMNQPQSPAAPTMDEIVTDQPVRAWFLFHLGPLQTWGLTNSTSDPQRRNGLAPAWWWRTGGCVSDRPPQHIRGMPLSNPSLCWLLGFSQLLLLLPLLQLLRKVHRCWIIAFHPLPSRVYPFIFRDSSIDIFTQRPKTAFLIYLCRLDGL